MASPPEEKLEELEDIAVTPPLTQDIFDTGRRRLAAVLLLVRRIDNEPHLVFMRRTEKVHSHKGQISFPGGGFKPEDGTLEQAAIRETEEELGIQPTYYRVLGELPAIDTVVSNFLIHPFLAMSLNDAAPLTYIPDDFEVAEVLELPLRALMNPAIIHLEEWLVGGETRQVRFYNYQSTVIWGATAFILKNLLEQLENGAWPELLA